MKREIKFRAFDPALNKMLFTGFSIIGEVTIFNGLEIMIQENPVENKTNLDRLLALEIMQFTGLKDRKGADIYEGDICKTYSHDEGELIDSVEFQNGCFVFSNPNKLSWPAGGYNSDYIEVIGNIHEHPNLLQP